MRAAMNPAEAEFYLLRDELLYAHAVVDVTDKDGAVFADGEIMAPVNLAVVIAEAAPLGENFSVKVEFEELATIKACGFEVAAVDDVQQIVGADCERPRAAKFRRFPNF